MSLDTRNTYNHYRRLSCDELLAETHLSSNFDSDSDPAEPPEDQSTLLRDPSERPSIHAASSSLRTFFIRTLALLCICSLSIGSHYASYILGPLKSRLAREIGTSHTDFGLLISAFSLNSTWTPLIGGVLASRLGTTYTSILATGVIFLGQFLLLIGDIWKDVRIMVLGLFVFGLGVSPLAVVQETIIVRFFKSHGLGVSMAFGLIAGKGASFVAARTSYPLTEAFGPRAPFYVATALTGFSVAINLVYIAFSKWLIDVTAAELEASDISEEARSRLVTNVSEAQALEKVAAKKKVHLHQITKLGDLFWAYIGLNVLCGMIWSPFTHLAANIIQTRYAMTERDAAIQASYLLAGSLILYPICGYVVDTLKHRAVIVHLLILSSCLTLTAYGWLALPPTWTKMPNPSIVLFALGHGFSPLLLVVLVPSIVPLKYVSTALGAHKSLEQTGSTIFQTLAGLALDTKVKSGPKDRDDALQHLLNVFLTLNVFQLLSILGLARLRIRRTQVTVSQRQSGISQDSGGEVEPLINRSSEVRLWSGDTVGGAFGSKSEIRRGRMFAFLSAVLIALAWVLFIGTAWYRFSSFT